MYLNSIGGYIPERRITNEYFEEVNGLTPEWLLQRTGIITRSRVSDDQDITTLGSNAVKKALINLPYDIDQVDLVISAGYTITDTVGTLAHRIQREFNISNAKVVAVTSACSSFVNAVEIAECYFAAGKATKALIVCAEINSMYSDDTNKSSGHLWGDASVAVFLSKEQQRKDEPEVMDVLTYGLAHVGKGPEGVCLYPKDGGITMNDGRDVFHYACIYMVQTLETLAAKHNIMMSDISYFACHQANLRIVKNVAQQLGMDEEKFFNNIQELGNTGSASAMLALSQNLEKINKGDIVGLTVFGGGYSAGGMLIKF